MSRYSTLKSVLPLLFFSIAKFVEGSSSAFHSGEPVLSSRLTESVRTPPRWKREGRAGDDSIVHLQIGLAHSGSDRLEQVLYEVSDPSHRKYGYHLSRSEVASIVAPSIETIRATEDWLLANGIAEFTRELGGHWIKASVSVRKAESLLNSEYYHFVNGDDGDSMLRSLEWSIPGHLREHIDTIQPTNSFFRAVPQDRYGGAEKPQWELDGKVPTFDELWDEDLVDRNHIDIPAQEDLPVHPTVDEACNRLAVSSLCLRVLYGTHDYEPQMIANGTNKIGLVNFLGNNNNRSDIAEYLRRYRPDAAAAGAETASIKTILLSGATDQQTPNTPEQMDRAMGIEGALDAQTLLGVAYPVPIVAWNVGGKPPFQASMNKVENSNEPYLEWLHHLLAEEDDNIPRVISISYADDEQTVPESYARRVCEAFAQLGARGVSVIVASGDDGVGKEGKCFSNSDDRGDTPKFLPTFPASCPFVTSVGGTRHLDPVMVGFDARSGFYAGGGFSDYFTRPRYQDSAVQPYVEGLNTTYHGLYNPKGRGIPDVSAMSYHFPIIWNGISHLLDGTSASAPTFAAIVALINDALLAEKLPPMGFLNPWLYSSALPGLNDVTVGSNHGCDTKGFSAVKGWDAATGLGTPWFPKLKELAFQEAFRWNRPWYMLNTQDI